MKPLLGMCDVSETNDNYILKTIYT